MQIDKELSLDSNSILTFHVTILAVSNEHRGESLSLVYIQSPGTLAITPKRCATGKSTVFVQ